MEAFIITFITSFLPKFLFFAACIYLLRIIVILYFGFKNNIKIYELIDKEDNSYIFLSICYIITLLFI
jgi:hypothetical protein